MSESTPIGLPRLIIGIAVFVLVGSPMVGYLWETLNQLLAGEVHPGRLLVSLPLLVVLAGVLMLLSQFVRRWEGEGQARALAARPPTP
jgi:hypothetical protein